MKEVKSARIKLEQLLDRIEAQVAFYDDNLRFESGGDTTEKKTVRLQRDTLYKEIWDISLSKVAKKYDVPYDRLKAACTKAKIPLPTQSYWGSIQAGKTVQKTPLPESSEKEVLIEFSYRKKATGLRLLLDEPAMKTEPAVPSTPEIVSAMRDSQNGRIIYNRETLYQEVWEQPVSKVAKKYGVSDVMIHKACKALNVPVPPRGYWAKIQAGQIVPKEPLPDASGKTALIGRRTESKAQEQKVAYTASIDSMSFLPDEERTRVIETALELWVDPDCKKLHPVLQKHKAAFSAWSKQHPRDKYANWNRDTYRSKPKDEPPLWESVTEETLPRVHRFLDPLYRAVEELGGKICDDLSMEIRGEHVSLKITEGRDQTPHVLTKDEIRQVEKYEQEKKKYHYAYEPKFRKYDYVPTGKLRVAAYGESYVRDTSSAGVEERIGEILLALYLQSEDVRIEREKREEAQRKAEEEKRQKELRRQKYNEEVDRLYALTNEARDFETACRIRAYVAAVEERPDLDVETINWVTWAKAKADWYDPTVAAVDPVFGKRDHSADKKEKTPEKKDSYHYW